MTQTTHSPGASFAPTKSFERIEAGITLQTSSALGACQVFNFGDYSPTPVAVPQRYLAIGDLVAKWSADQTRSTAMEEARRWMASAFHADDGVTVRTLRMRKGLSQQQLATTIGTSQPHIARIEGGADNLHIDTCRRLSAALGVDMNQLDAALRREHAVKQTRLA